MQIDLLREEFVAIRQEMEELADRADASARRADASEAREGVAQDRAEASAKRQDAAQARADISEARADAGEVRERTAMRRVDAIEALVAKNRLRIDDLEAHVDIDRQLILELHEAGVLRQDQVNELQTALRTSRVIGEAIGIVMTRGFVTQDDAFALLRRTSNNTNRKLREIAEDIVLTGDAAALV